MLQSKERLRIVDDDLRAAVSSLNKQFNQDAAELVVTMVLLVLFLAGVVIFQSELHDLLLPWLGLIWGD